MLLDRKGEGLTRQEMQYAAYLTFQLNEEILNYKARNRIQLRSRDADIHIYQDLPHIMLQHRKDLRPLLEILREWDIHYRWKSAFSLPASTQGRTALLRVSEDLHTFCDTLDLTQIKVPYLYADFRGPPMRRGPHHEEPMDAQDQRYRKQ